LLSKLGVIIAAISASRDVMKALKPPRLLLFSSFQ
jgi:hypothetical protein